MREAFRPVRKDFDPRFGEVEICTDAKGNNQFIRLKYIVLSQQEA